MRSVSNLDKPMLRLSRQGDFLSGRDGYGGIHFWGVQGGGKTSSAQMLAGALLRAGYGGYVTAAKPEVIPQWLSYGKKHGRGNSIVLMDENEGFNLLEYEMSRHGLDGIGTVVEYIMRIIDASRRASGTASQRGGEIFWEDSSRVVQRYTLPVLYAANGTLTFPDIIRFITTAPTSAQQAANAQWQQTAFMFRILKLAAEQPKVRMSGAALQNIVNFWREQWISIPDKTRGNIVISITAALDRFNHGRLNRFFCGKTSVVPEMSLHGAVLVDAKPTLTWNEDGAIAQQLFKFAWQRMVLNRNSLEAVHRERPLVLWSDESQETVAPYDGEFLGLSRESKCCTVYLSQTLPTYFAKIGGDNPRDAAIALAGKFKTHVFCTNSCPETNDFASRMIGKVLTRRANYSEGNSESVNEGMSSGENENRGSSHNSGGSWSTSAGMQASRTHGSNSGFGSTSGTGSNWGSNRGRGTSQNESRGYSESMEPAIEPGDFARCLKSGGPQNGNRVTAVWFQAGRTFKASGRNFLVAEFEQ